LELATNRQLAICWTLQVTCRGNSIVTFSLTGEPHADDVT